MFEFHYQQGSRRRKLFQASGTYCAIGTARSNELCIESRQLCKRHAELRLQHDGIYLTDLGSIAGCWVNAQRVERYGPLCDLDDISLGDITIRIPVQAGRERSTQSTRLKVTTSTDTSRQIQAMAPHARADMNDASYIEQEPHLCEQMSHWVRIIHELLLKQMDLQRKDVNRMSDEALRQEAWLMIEGIITQLSDELPEALDSEQLHRHVLNESVGLGPLEYFLEDETITEIMVNSHQEVYVERAGQLERSPLTFSSDATVMSVIERIITPLGRRIDEGSPIVDARLKDGSRVNAIIPPLALKGPSLTIRKFSRKPLQFNDLVASKTLSAEMVGFLRVCVEQRRNIIVSGGTGSGKTTLLNVLSNFIPHAQRIVTIEDAAELRLVQPNLVSLESRPANTEGRGEVHIRDLVRNALRMRPDRIVVGECRGAEALDMLQAMNTGHDGSLTTLHANNPRDALSRLEVLILMAGFDLPVAAIREQIASAVDLIIQQSRFQCGSRKITRVTEVVGVESGTIQLQDIFRFEQQGTDPDTGVSGEFVATGEIPVFYDELRHCGLDVDLGCFHSSRDRRIS